MEFAKVFDFPTGQLLVERDWERIGSSGTGYSYLLIKTKMQLPAPGGVVTATAKTVYPTVQEAVAYFTAFDEQQAQRTFEAYQRYLAEGRKITLSTNHEEIFERPKRQMLTGTPYRPPVGTHPTEEDQGA
jgi:hypothetical protein